MARTKQEPKKGAEHVRKVLPVDRESTKESVPVVIDSNSPTLFRFVLVTVLGLGTSFALRSISSPFSTGDLGGVTTQRDDWTEIAGFLGWRVAELATAWWSEYDAWDVGALTCLARLPYYFLLVLCYDIRRTTAGTSLLIDVASSAFPFYLLRKLSPPNSSHAPKYAIANPSVVKDLGSRWFTAFAAAGLHGVVVYSSVRTWLPIFLVTHFEGLRSLDRVHAAIFGVIVISCSFTGYSATTFIFTPSMAAIPDSRDARNAAFNPATATFGETVFYNLWGHSKRTRTLIKRTLAAIVASSGYSLLQTSLVVEGAEVVGAAGWAAMWAVAHILTGVLFWWIGDARGITN